MAPQKLTGSPSEQVGALRRLLQPKTIAIVGLSDRSTYVQFLRPTFDSDADIFLVNPKYSTVQGRPTYPSITAIGRPIDAVIPVMSAQRTTELAEECADLDVGGLVLVAGGFAEAGPAGAHLQSRVESAARRGGMAVIGPNGLGYVNVPERLSLTIASPHKRRPGTVSVVSQSGAILSGVAMAAWQRPGMGLNMIISAGNEAVTDLADYVDFLTQDPGTSAIGLVIEKVRRPEAFFSAVRRATEAGKPVVALKLGRSSRTQQLAASHTGAMTGDAWVYDVAFAQAGIAVARDPEELVDRLSIIPQIEPARWSRVEKLGVITMTGGFASLSFDIACEEGLDLPALDSMAAWVRENLPGTTVPNPLDRTGLSRAPWPEIVELYSRSDELDALLFIHPLADEDDYAASHTLVKDFIAAAEAVAKPCVVANCAGPLGDFAEAYVAKSPAVASGHGLRSSLRGLATLGHFVRHRRDGMGTPAEVAPKPRPTDAVIPLPEGPMLPFADAMRLLSDAGIPVAPFQLVEPAAEVSVPEFDGPYVVKLADVGHRTEHGTVRINVTGPDLTAAVGDMRTIAARDGLSPLVAIQQMVDVEGELLLGIQSSTELGPMVVLGFGGVLVEALNRIGGRMAPLDRSTARELIDEFADVKIMHGFRARAPWDLDALVDIIVAAGTIAAAGRDWIDSFDVNPLIYGKHGFMAVDALCLGRKPDAAQLTTCPTSLTSRYSSMA